MSDALTQSFPRRKALALLLASATLSSGACRSPQPARDAVAPMLALVEAQQRAWNAGSVEDFMAAGYWRSSELTFLSGGDWTRGYDTVLERYRKRYVEGDGEMGRLAFTELEAQRLGTDFGLVRGKWTLRFEQAEPMWGLFTLVLERLGDGWRIVHDHTSLGSKPAE